MKEKFDEEKITAILSLILYIVWLLFFASVELTIPSFLKHVIFLGLIIFLNRKDLFTSFKELLADKKKFKWIFGSFIVVTLLMFGGGVIQIVLSSLEFTSDTSNSILTEILLKIPWGTLYALFVTIIFTAMLEEVIYRKSLHPFINNKFIFVIVSSLLAWYFQVTLTNPNIAEFINSLPIFLISLYLGFIYTKKDNIWYTYFPRILYNLFATILILFF